MARGVKTQAELNAHIMKQLQSVLDKEVAYFIKDEQSKQVEKVVYNSYTPKQYERRGNDGGLSDVRNMVHVINPTGAFSYEMMISNLTTGKSIDGKEQPNRYIAWGVEVGHDRGGTYDAPARPYAMPRRFTQATIDNLQNSQKFREVVIVGLRLRGFTVR